MRFWISRFMEHMEQYSTINIIALLKSRWSQVTNTWFNIFASSWFSINSCVKLFGDRMFCYIQVWKYFDSRHSGITVISLSESYQIKYSIVYQKDCFLVGEIIIHLKFVNNHPRHLVISFNTKYETALDVVVLCTIALDQDVTFS